MSEINSSAANGTHRDPAMHSGSEASAPKRFLLVRTGCTDYDQQRRIKGRLDIPLNEQGADEVTKTVDATSDLKIGSVYSAPCRASLQTAQSIAAKAGKKVKASKDLQNLGHGLWEGKLVDEVRAQQPKVFRRWQEQPDTVCPPEGEMLAEARQRLNGMVAKAVRKNKSGVIAFVLPEPLATVFSCQMQGNDLGDLWQAEKNSGKWELFDYYPDVTNGHSQGANGETQ